MAALNTSAHYVEVADTVIVDDEILEAAAKDGGLENSVWPGLLERILPRLDNIVQNDFPIPSIPLSGGSHTPPRDHESTFKPDLPSSQDSSSQSSQNTNKENAPPPPSPPSRPPVPAFSATTTPTQRIPDSQPSSITTPDGTLPPQLLSILTFIQQTLRTSFSASPPHTIQRFAELILRPRQHYRTLPSYLRALDRVVTVSSGADMFPLPEISLPNSSESVNGGLLNGTTSSSLGSDESLGGALLTPIPWLRDNAAQEAERDGASMLSDSHHTANTPSASSSTNGLSTAPPQREDGTVTQGEILRQEQEAGVVPVTPTTTAATSPLGRQTRSATASTARAMAMAEDEADTGVEGQLEHARGPDEVGMEDMGPQGRGAARGGFDVEAAVGRHVPKGEGAEEEREKNREGNGQNETRKDKDDDVVITDADGRTEGDVRKAES